VASTPGTSKPVAAGVDQDPSEPGVEPVRIPEAAVVPPCSDERVVGRILSLLCVAEDQPSEAVGGIQALGDEQLEGGGSRQYRHTKTLMYADPAAWHRLMERLSETVVDYLRAQVAAGAQAVQLFDSWVGCLGPDDYRTYVLPHMRATFTALADAGVPTIHFGTGTAALLELVREGGGDVIGLDWHVDLADAWARVGHDVAVQGNLDPVALFAPPDEIRRRVAQILGRAAGRPGHVFNLGHGVLPETPLEHVGVLIDAVHELSAGR